MRSSSSTKQMVLAAVILFSAPLPARAKDCKYLLAGLKDTIANYKAYRAENDESLGHLLEQEKKCQDAGAIASSTVAKNAAALSCEAQRDAAEMNQQLMGIGQTCQENFTKLHALQTQLRAAFESVKDDLDVGVKIMKKSDILLEACREEITQFSELAQHFEVLESSVLTVEGRSVNGQTNYTKFTEMATNLQAQTASRNLSCGLNPSLAATAPASGKAREAFPKGIPAGTPTASRSDVTGVREEASLSGAAGGKGSPRERPSFDPAIHLESARKVVAKEPSAGEPGSGLSLVAAPPSSAVKPDSAPGGTTPAGPMESLSALILESTAEAANPSALPAASPAAVARAPQRQPAALEPSGNATREQAPAGLVWDHGITKLEPIQVAGAAQSAAPTEEGLKEASLFSRVHRKYTSLAAASFP